MTAQADRHAPRVVLVGPPGAGKSTIGRKLAKELDVELYDTDAGIEAEAGRTIAEIFAADGEPGFRSIEEDVVRRALHTEPGVVSLGGGAILSTETRKLLRDHTVVYLELSVAEGLRRTGTSTARPLLNDTDPSAKYRELMRERRPLYREVATVRVRTDGRSPGRVVRAIMHKLSLEPAADAPRNQSASDVCGTGKQNQQGKSKTRARRRARARAAARRAATNRSEGNQEEQTASADAPATAADTGQSDKSGTTSGGRSRRARARRARARRRRQQERTEEHERTESEQHT